jgi:hypothetical protein
MGGHFYCFDSKNRDKNDKKQIRGRLQGDFYCLGGKKWIKIARRKSKPFSLLFLFISFIAKIS